MASARKTVIAYSGGLDSTTLLYKLLAEGDEVVALNFSYGAKLNAVERQHAKAICAQQQVAFHEVDLPFIGKLFKSALLVGGAAIPKGDYNKESMSQTVVPGRNGIFLSILGGYAESIGAQRVALANHAGDHYLYPDCRSDWIAAISLTIFLGSEGKVSIHAPFTDCDKGAICKLAQTLKVPLAQTWSCYEGGSLHCGSCSTCLDRKQAFVSAGMDDPTTYSCR